MNRLIIKFGLQALMLLAIITQAGLGLLLKFVLPAGKEILTGNSQTAEWLWLGLDRHDWSAIQCYLAFIVLGLLVIHIILHWGAIVSLYENIFSNATVRTIAAPVFAVAALFLLTLPLLGKPVLKEVVTAPGTPKASPPALVSESDSSIPVVIPIAEKTGGPKISSLKKPRPRKIASQRRVVSHPYALGAPMRHGKLIKNQKRHCKYGAFLAYRSAPRGW